MNLKLILVAGSLVIFSQAATAGLFDALESIGKDITAALEAPAVSGVEASPPEAGGGAAAGDAAPAAALAPAEPLTPAGEKAMEALRVQSTGIYGMQPRCNTWDFQRFIEREQQIQNHIRRGEGTLARGAASVLANDMAVCYLKSPRPLEGAERIGSLLVISAYYSFGGSEAFSAASRAFDLLEYANTDSAKAMLAKLGEKYRKKSADQKEVVPDAKDVALKGTAKEIAQQYLGNTFAFNKKYSEKTIEATGKIGRIFDFKGKLTPSTVSIGLIGIEHQEEIKSAEVLCKISDPKLFDKAMDVTVGQTIRVRGIYAPAKWLVKLEKCVIVDGV